MERILEQERLVETIHAKGAVIAMADGDIGNILSSPVFSISRYT